MSKKNAKKIDKNIGFYEESRSYTLIMTLAPVMFRNGEILVIISSNTEKNYCKK